MKKSISILLAALMLLSVFSITATAANGPKPNQESGSASIYFKNVKEDGKDDIILLSAGEINNEAIEGAKYDLEKNTLTLTDFDHPELALYLEDMGDDFKLNIVGECTVHHIISSTGDYGGSITITGNGLLVVNPEREYQNAIYFTANGADSTLHIDNTVGVQLLSCENAVEYNGTSHADKDTVFMQGQDTVVVEGGKNTYDSPVTIDGAYVGRDNETKTGYRAHQVNDPYYQDGIYSVTISQSDGGGNIYHVEKYIISDKFGVWVKDESFEPRDLDETEFNNNYKIDTRQGDVPKTITYTDEAGEEQTGYLVVSTIQGEEDQLFVIDIDFNKDPSDDIHRAKPIERTPTGYTIVMTWGGYEVNYTSFFGRGLSYVYDDVYDDFMKPNIATGTFEVYEDAEGNRYVFDDDDNVYRISEDNKVTIEGEEYYVLTMWQGVSKENLTAVTQVVDDNYNYQYPHPDYTYTAPPATPDEAETTAASTTESEEAGTTAAPEPTTEAVEPTTEGQEPTTTAAPEQPTTEAQQQPTTEAPQATTAAPKTEATEPTVKEIKKGSSEKQIDKFVTSLKTEKDPKGSKFGLLCARQKKATKKSATVKWNKLNGAKKYIVYGSLCGTKKGQVPPYKKITKTAKTSYTRKGLKKGTYFKFLIVALDKKGKVIASSKTVHIATKGGKVGNDKTVKVTTNKVGLKLKGKKTFKLKAKEVPQSKKLKVKRHRKIKYESSNPKVAKVNGKGKITAKKKGKATIFVYAQNGLYKKVKVTVK